VLRERRRGAGRSARAQSPPNGKEYAEEQRSLAKPKEEWIAVPVPLDAAFAVPRPVVEAARENVRSRSHHYKESSRVWELAGGVLYCVHCGRRMSFASVKRGNGKRTPYYRCQGHRRNGHKEGCPNARHYRAVELEEQVWRFVHGILTDPERLRRGLNAMIEEKRGAMRGDPDKEAKVLLGKIAEADRRRARAQDLAVEGLLSPDELRAKLSALEEAREAAEDALEALRERKGKVEELERDRDALLERYAGMIPEGLDAMAAEERCWAYKRIRLNVFADAEGSLSATWAFTKDPSVISQNARDDEGNAYLRLGEAYERLGRDDEARAAYERGVGQAEKFGHDGMADALRLALSELGHGA
jgi:hypothetical protein